MSTYSVFKKGNGRAAVGALAALATIAGATAGRPATAHAALPPLIVNASSVQKEVFSDLTSAFRRLPDSAGVPITATFAASRSQALTILSAQKGDIASLDTQSDMAQLVGGLLLTPNWANNDAKGFVANSVIVFVVRPGNPKGIKTWADLVKPGVQIDVPLPFTSGSGRWAALAAYGAQLELKKTPDQAKQYVKDLYKNVVAQPNSARDALNAFAAGTGDVLLTYESEAIGGLQRGVPLQYVIPGNTILVQEPMAVLTPSGQPQLAQAFVDFARSDAGQDLWARRGFRPVLPAVAERWKASYPTPHHLFTVTDKLLGGWAKVNGPFFDPTGGLLASIERTL
jgi:sulfate transport system substrate-binding protein